MQYIIKRRHGAAAVRKLQQFEVRSSGKLEQEFL